MSVFECKTGTLANAATSLATPLFWDDTVGPAPETANVTIITVSTTVEMTVTIREAATLAELTTPYGGIHHEFTEVIPANSTRRLIVGQDESLPVGWAWVSNNSGGSGNYSITGSRRSA